MEAVALDLRAFAPVLMGPSTRFNFVNVISNGQSRGRTRFSSASGRLLRPLRRSDVVARYGGDEFVILLPETKYGACPATGQQAARLCIRLSLAAREKPQRQLRIACYPLPASSPPRAIPGGRRFAVSFETSVRQTRPSRPPLTFDPNEANKWTVTAS